MRYILFITLLITSAAVKAQNPLKDCKHCMVIAEQSQNRIIILNADNNTVVWEWKANASNVKPEHAKWFNTPSDAKAVYNNEYVLTNASGGGVALIRIADKKAVFYAYAGGNTHSAELLPDGNIVSASSTGNYLMLFKTDTLNCPEPLYTKKIYLTFAHNVVWDRKREKLWSAGLDSIFAFRYNNNCEHPDLIREEAFPTPGKDGHDLFPVYGSTSKLWFTNTKHVYQFDVVTRKFEQANVIQPNIKSISNGPAGYPAIVIQPNESWWTDEVLDTNGKHVAGQTGWKMYKARWVLHSNFEYPKKHSIRICK